MKEKIINKFSKLFGNKPEFLIRAPGRVNLIGEHTDYNQGFVLPMGIQYAVWMAIRKRKDRVVRAISLDFQDTQSFALNEFQKEGDSWVEYAKAVAWVLQENDLPLEYGFDAIIRSDIPIGAGLSSSAAIELAFARAFLELNNHVWNPKQMAMLCQKAENQWVGVNCGIMDQLVIAEAVEGTGLFIDCRSLDCEPVPLPKGTVILIMDTATRRKLVGSEYNKRRLRCYEAAEFLGVESLRDVELVDLEARYMKMDDVLYRCAHHVVSENQRVLNTIRAMRRGDMPGIGELFNQSHLSLSEDYEVSSRELDLIVDIAKNQSGCLGARMTGAGFGGCAIAIVEADNAELIAKEIILDYFQKTNLEAKIIVTQAKQGTQILNLN